MSKVKGIIELLVAAVLVGLVIWTNVMPDEGRRIEDAIYLDDAQVLPENEGKRVIVAGTVTVRETATDTDLGISLDSPLMRRKVEKLKYFDEWQWSSVSDASVNESLTDANFVGKASIGQFELDEHLVRTLPASERDWDEDDLDAATIERLERQWNFVLDGGQLYISQAPPSVMDLDHLMYSELEGSYRVRYRMWHPGQELKATVVGIQRGNTLCYDPDLNASPAFEGVLTVDEMVKENGFGVLMGEIIFAGIPAIILTILGVRNVLDL